MSVSGLKAELKFLESIFDPNHERFRIIDWKPDELSCQFNVTGEKLLIIHCNITVSGRAGAAHKLARPRSSTAGTYELPCLQHSRWPPCLHGVFDHPKNGAKQPVKHKRATFADTERQKRSIGTDAAVAC